MPTPDVEPLPEEAREEIAHTLALVGLSLEYDAEWLMPLLRDAWYAGVTYGRSMSQVANDPAESPYDLT